jgi:hypothetical protein
MMILGPMEMILMLAFSGGGNDVVDFLDASAYFQSRNIPATVEKMTELSQQDPTDGKTQIRQLLALRWLAENAGEVKKAKNFEVIRQQLVEVARGKKAQDLQGFAADYAGRTLTALGVMGFQPALQIPDDSARKDALAWFPQSVTLATSSDLRFKASEAAEGLQAFRKLVLGMAPANAMDEIYLKLEELGNIRLDRVSFAYQEVQNKNQSKIYFRFTGKADHKRLVDFLQKHNPRMEIEEKKAFRGRKITQITENSSPALLIIGDEDFLMVGLQSLVDNTSKKLAEEILDVRDGKSPSVLAGPLGKNLETLSSKASAVFVGDMPEDMRRGLPGNVFPAIPKHLVAQLLPEGAKSKLSVTATLDNAEDAKSFVQEVDKWKKQGLDTLKNPPPLPPGFPVPDKLFEKLKDALNSVKAEAKGSISTATMTISSEFANPGMTLFPFIFAGSRSEKKLAPPPVKEEKKEKKQSRLDLAPESTAIRHYPWLTHGREFVMCWQEGRHRSPSSIST